MYQYENAFNASVEYFEGDELAAKVFLDKYALRDNDGNLLEQTPTEMHHRIAKEFARIESKKFKNPLTEEEIFGLLDHFKYIIPQGSPMFGIGNNHQIVSLSNCYVVESPEDSYGGICRVDEMLCQISKRRGGVGLDISKIRPAGSGVKNAARNSTGVVSFMERYSNTIREVGQSGRRGALMLTIHVAHPDVEQFVTVKNDATKVTGANISVLLSDEFLSAVEKGEKFRLRFPVDAPPSDTDKWVDAKELWMKMINNAWLRAEPGLLFWDKIKKYNAVDCYHEEGFDTVSTNPCCFAKSSEVMVITKDGIKEIKAITSNDEIWIDDEQVWAKTTGYFDAGKAEVFKVTFSNNEELFITANHKLAKTKFKRVGKKVVAQGFDLIELKDLIVGDKVTIHANEVTDYNFGTKGNYAEGVIMGWLTGDGCLSYHDDAAAYPNTILDFWKQEHDVCEIVHEFFQKMNYDLTVQTNKINDVHRIQTRVFTEQFTNKYEYNIWNFKSENKKLDFLNDASEEFLKGYLSAYFTADGTVYCHHEASNYNVSLASINKNRLIQIKNILNVFGIKSSVCKLRDAGESSFNNSKYATKDCWRVIITGKIYIERFKNEIGFLSKTKQDLLEKIFNQESLRQPKCGQFTKIESIESVGIQEVGCIEVQDYHRFTANGIISGNSEITLSKFDSCRLMAMNLYSYVVDPFTNGSYFDYDLFEKHSEIIQRLMDDMIDLEEEKILQIIAKIKKDPEEKGIKARELELWQNIHDRCIKGRRTGTGVTAMGDTLAALGLKYGSEESIFEVNKIMKTLCLSSFRSSMEMAKDIGTFPIWNWEKEKDSEFLAMIKENDPKLYKDISIHGRRNIANLTIAPTGTVSILTQTTSGVEPLFMLFPYTRRKKINPTDKNAKVDFVDQNGDSWQEFTVYHPKVKKWMEITGEKDLTKSPWHGCCAEEINWVDAVRLQAAAQKYIDHAISKTVNLPENVAVEEVAKIYEAAWKYGVKGCTIYRSNCRTGVLVDKSKEEKPKNKIQKNDAPKRPASIDAEVHFSKVKGDDYYVVVGLLDGDPYEVFAGINTEGDKPIVKKNVNKGKLKKKTRGQYSLVAGTDEFALSGIHNHENGDSLCRMLSTALRHGADINFVVHQLEKTQGDLSSLSKVLARSLKKYIKDGSTVSGENCGQCENGKLERQDGCVICKSCGWTKCG
jgi:ribonucleotide reductase alpha subunit